ncbi:MAG: hypothetical protein HY906_14100 [Deltaproteobacteria bacterium]|nr:hypothetical protein [Deltaproteobacteria bacterium]
MARAAPPAPASQPASAPASQAAPAAALDQELAAAVAADTADSARKRGGGTPAAAPPGGRGFQSLNPDLSVIGDLTGGYYQHTPRSLSGDDPARTGLNLQELEVAFAAVVDPYFRADVYLTIPNLEGIEVEEAALTTLSLPWSLQLRAGMLRATLGRQNSQHLHTQDFTRRPALNSLLLGPDGFRAPGAEVSWLTPLPFYCMLYAGIYSVFEPRSVGFAAPRPTFGGGADQDLTYLGALKAFFPLTERLSLYAGGSFATGKAPVVVDGMAGVFEPTVRAYLYGGDLYLKWAPPNVAESFFTVAWQTEWFGRSLEGQRGSGALYSQVVMRVARRWQLGVRGDFLGLPRGRFFHESGVMLRDERGYVATLAVTWNLTEFSRIRLQGEGHFNDRTLDGSVKNFGVALVQLEYSMGAHGAHQY